MFTLLIKDCIILKQDLSLGVIHVMYN